MNKIFIVKHWVFTLLCGPIIFLIVNGFNANWSSNNIFDFFQLYPFMILIGLLFSLPTYIFCSIIFVSFKTKNIKMIYKQTILLYW